MTEDPNRAEVLVNVATEAQASLIVALLDEHGIEAHATGGFTSGFRAGMPGEVHVLVKATDLDRARVLLDEASSNPPESDAAPI